MNGKIYIIKNKLNNKIYIGQTVLSIQERFKTHLKLARTLETSQYIHKAINKYGKENFTINLLQCNIPSQKELNNWEEFYIKTYNSLNKGYNLCPGGCQWRKPKHKAWEYKNEIIKLYKEGLSTRKIAEQYDCSAKLIKDILKVNNVILRSKNCNLPDRTSIVKLNELKNYIAKGLTNSEIAKKYKVHYETIRRIRKKNNI